MLKHAGHGQLLMPLSFLQRLSNNKGRLVIMWFKFLQDNGFYEQGWDCDPDGAVFYCPEDGNGIEPDGVCYCGNKSPLLQAGMI
jgi:hypothetical protein